MSFKIENGILKEYVPENHESYIEIPSEVTEIADYVFMNQMDRVEVKLNDGLRLIAVYAQRDGLFDYDGYEQAKSSFPEKTREAMITGANHSGFGAYEKPEMDHEALISSSLQQRLAAQMVRMALMGAD